MAPLFEKGAFEGAALVSPRASSRGDLDSQRSFLDRYWSNYSPQRGIESYRSETNRSEPPSGRGPESRDGRWG